MPREIALGDLLVPALLLAFLAALVVFLCLDRLLTRKGCYSLVWHPALLRLSILMALFCALGLAIYR